MREQLVATVCGVVDKVNKLITVRTLHRRYAPEVGDIVLGRVTEVSCLDLPLFLHYSCCLVGNISIRSPLL